MKPLNHKYFFKENTHNEIVSNILGVLSAVLFTKVCRFSNDLFSCSLLQYFKFGPNSLACSTCGKHFKMKMDVVRHMRIHSAQKPFCCMYCDYASTQKGNLNRHISTMHNEIIIPSKSMKLE